MEQLRGIHLPPEPSLWPPAPGWWLLALLAAVALWRLLSVSRRILARRRRRRSALRALTRIQSRVDHESPCVLCADVSVLLREIAATHFAGDDVAALTGEAWVQFLERSVGGDADFTRVRRALLEAPYRRGGDADVHTLVSTARVWVGSVM